MTVPVLLLVFNRSEPALQVVERIGTYQPTQLFVAADGPRPDVATDAARCEDTRRLVLDAVTWNCDVHTLFRQQNLGCARAVTDAISWFFSNVDHGIILEDDCLPDASFFNFCAELLERYKDNAEVMHINGSNYQAGRRRGSASYYASRLAHVWGWATWRRSWAAYDHSMERYATAPRTGLNRRLWRELDQAVSGHTNAWGIKWATTVWFNQGLVMTPNTSLVRNIGFGENATHTRRQPGWIRAMSYGQVNSIEHPVSIAACREADRYTERHAYNSGPTYWAKQAVKRVLNRPGRRG